jgi:hypothetical protein
MWKWILEQLTKEKNAIQPEEYSLLGCNAVEFGDSPTFRNNLSPPYSVWMSKPSKLEQVKTRAQLAACFCWFLGWPSPNCTALQPKRPQASYLPPREPQIQQLKAELGLGQWRYYERTESRVRAKWCSWTHTKLGKPFGYNDRWNSTETDPTV